MLARRITISDVISVTGYQRDEFHSLIRGVPTFASRSTEPRRAKPYSPQELALFCVCHDLEKLYGMRRENLRGLIPEILRILSEPRNPIQNARLLVTLKPPQVTFVDHSADPIRAGVVVPLGEIFTRLDRYLSSPFPGWGPAAGEVERTPSELHSDSETDR